MDWLTVCADGDIADGEAIVVGRERTGHDDEIAVFFEGGRYFALDDTCTHDRASLGEGWVEDGEVECPLHAARFCLSDGKAMCLPAVKDTRTHNVQVRDGHVLLLAASATG